MSSLGEEILEQKLAGEHSSLLREGESESVAVTLARVLLQDPGAQSSSVPTVTFLDPYLDLTARSGEVDQTRSVN